MDVNREQALETVAWLLMGGTGSTPGVLRLTGGGLAFEAHGRGALTGRQLKELERVTGHPGLADHLDGGGAATIFHVARSEIGEVRFPWYYFGGGMKLTVNGTGFRFSFLKPQNTTAGPDLTGIPAGRASGRAWKAVLA